MIKFKLLALCAVLSFSAAAQKPTQFLGVPTNRVEVRGQLKMDSLAMLPRYADFPTLDIYSDTLGAMFWRMLDSHLYVRDTVFGGGHRWVILGPGNSSNVYLDSNYVTLIVISGESNAAGVGFNSFATTLELSDRSIVQINQPSGVFQDLNIGANNNLTGSVNVHGLELEIANQAAAFFNRPVYMVKAGVSGSKIDQWGLGSANFDTLTFRTARAVAAIYAMHKVPRILWFYLQGVNDAVTHTNPVFWRTSTLALFTNFRNEFGFCPAIMAHIMLTTETTLSADTLNREMDTLASVPGNFVYTVYTPSQPVGGGINDSVETGGLHWQYKGLKGIADEMLTVADSAGFYFNSQATDNNARVGWKTVGNSGTDSNSFLGTTDNQPLSIRTNNVRAMYFGTDQNVGIRTTTPQAALEVGADIIVNSHTLGRGRGNIASNVVFGNGALQNNIDATNGVSVGVISSAGTFHGCCFVNVGYQAGGGNQGIGNVFLGFQAGIGCNGAFNTFLGTQAGGSWADGLSNFLCISNGSLGGIIVGDHTTGRVQINSANTPVLTASAQFEIRSGTTPLGFLEPTFTTTVMNTIASPATGLQAYNTTEGLPMHYDGAGFKSIGMKYPHTIFAPATGGTVALINDQYNIINPAGTIATLTVNFPSSPVNNDRVTIKYTQTVTVVTYGNGTVVGATNPVAGTVVTFVYDGGTTSWY